MRHAASLTARTPPTNDADLSARHSRSVSGSPVIPRLSLPESYDEKPSPLSTRMPMSPRIVSPRQAHGSRPQHTLSPAPGGGTSTARLGTPRSGAMGSPREEQDPLRLESARRRQEASMEKWLSRQRASSGISSGPCLGPGGSASTSRPRARRPNPLLAGGAGSRASPGGMTTPPQQRAGVHRTGLPSPEPEALLESAGRESHVGHTSRRDEFSTDHGRPPLSPSPTRPGQYRWGGGEAWNLGAARPPEAGDHANTRNGSFAGHMRTPSFRSLEEHTPAGGLLGSREVLPSARTVCSAVTRSEEPPAVEDLSDDSASSVEDENADQAGHDSMYGRMEKLATKSQLLITEMSAYVTPPAPNHRPPRMTNLAMPPVPQNAPPPRLPATWIDRGRPPLQATLQDLLPHDGAHQQPHMERDGSSLQAPRMGPAASSSSTASGRETERDIVIISRPARPDSMDSTATLPSPSRAAPSSGPAPRIVGRPVPEAQGELAELRARVGDVEMELLKARSSVASTAQCGDLARLTQQLSEVQSQLKEACGELRHLKDEVSDLSHRIASISEKTVPQQGPQAGPEGEPPLSDEVKSSPDPPSTTSAPRVLLSGSHSPPLPLQLTPKSSHGCLPMSAPERRMTKGCSALVMPNPAMWDAHLTPRRHVGYIPTQSAFAAASQGTPPPTVRVPKLPQRFHEPVGDDAALHGRVSPTMPTARGIVIPANATTSGSYTPLFFQVQRKLAAAGGGIPSTPLVVPAVAG
eukprot:CAMPEP_0178423094 /NCGR_PEP_ID=MMETSP0689_2-20121128/27513_1 /TAXON_ID=160604 /ORGANISM="Amphidinium massartii, Strain CS-259" /LENGTH=750 /DNA_ID=CAMNT_0020044681 /DNA_START=99 /DNA_END=2351 /DNA_ORIENTATION=-